MQSPLRTAAISTFESLALLFAEESPDQVETPPPLAHAMRVAFTGAGHGAFDGALVVAVSDDVAAALAANMLGVPPEAADARTRRDALGEVANVVCGNVLPLLGGRQAVFHLGAPHEVALEAVDRPPSPDAAALRETLVVETGVAAVVLHAPVGLAEVLP